MIYTSAYRRDVCRLIAACTTEKVEYTLTNKQKKITYPTNSRSRLLKLTPVDVFARISKKIWGNFRTMHMTSVLKLAKCSSVSDSMIIMTTIIPTEIC